MWVMFFHTFRPYAICGYWSILWVNYFQLGHKNYLLESLDQEVTKTDIMTFWQENYGFIKEVYDTRWLLRDDHYHLLHLRYAKMTEWMDNVEMAIAKVEFFPV